VKARDIIDAMLARPVAFQPIFAKVADGAIAGLFLSQAWYWTKVSAERDGWFWKTQAEWQEELCLSRWEQETARKMLRAKKLLEERLRGNPSKLWFRVNIAVLHESIRQHVGLPQAEAQTQQDVQDAVLPHAEIPQAEKPHARSRKNRNLACGKTTSSKGTENTSETTSETTKASCAEPSSTPARRSVIKLPLNNGNEHTVTEADAQEYQELYPAVDVKQQLRNMRGWLISHPSNRKTNTGVKAFITKWLKREQDNAPIVRDAAPVVSKQLHHPVKAELDLPANLVPDPSAWQAIADHLAKSVNPHSFETWLKPVRGLGMADGVLYVSVPTPEFLHIGSKYADIINAAKPAGVRRIEYRAVYAEA
jgi:hypothetical protein